jgi:hypothetical protein
MQISVSELYFQLLSFLVSELYLHIQKNWIAAELKEYATHKETCIEICYFYLLQFNVVGTNRRK